MIMDTKMKTETGQSFSCLTLLQPWASFVIWGLKTWETRSRNIGIPIGTLLIHSSKRVDKVGERVYAEVIYKLSSEHPNRIWPAYEKLTRGAVLGSVVVRSTLNGFQPANLTDLEKMVGDFSPGRYFANLESPKAFDQPIPASGQRGMWKLRIAV